MATTKKSPGPKKKKKARSRPKQTYHSTGRVCKPKSIDDYFADDGTLKNLRHELFCQTWLQTFNIKESLQAAGFKVADDPGRVNARRLELMRREEVHKRMRDILSARTKELAIDDNWIVMQMFDTYQKCIEQRPITNKDGDILGWEYQDLRTAMATLEKLGQNIGMFQKHKAPQRPVILQLNYGGEPPERPALQDPTAIEGQASRLN